MTTGEPPEPAEARPARPWWKKAAVVALGLLAGLGATEIVLRLVGFEYRLTPEVIDFGAPSRHEIETYFAQDEDLIWVPRDYGETLAGYRDNPPQIAFLGDSCTHLGGYPRDTVEAILRRTGRSALTFANLGVVGWSTYQGRRQLERDVVPLAPRVVTLYFGWNDHWVGFGIEDVQVGKAASFARFGLADLRLAQAGAKFWVAADPQAGTRPNRVAPEDFRANLRHMVRTARAHGIEPVLLTAPSSHERGRVPEKLLARFLRSAEELIPLHAEYVAIVREVAAAEDAPLCDLERDLPPRPARRDLFDADGIHPNRAGDRLIAALLLDTLAEHGLLEALAGP